MPSTIISHQEWIIELIRIVSIREMNKILKCWIDCLIVDWVAFWLLKNCLLFIYWLHKQELNLKHVRRYIFRLSTISLTKPQNLASLRWLGSDPGSLCQWVKPWRTPYQLSRPMRHLSLTSWLLVCPDDKSIFQVSHRYITSSVITKKQGWQKKLAAQVIVAFFATIS